MNKGFKNILAVSTIIICGFLYILGNNEIAINNTRYKGMEISLNDKTNVVEEGNGLLLVNSKLGLDTKYKPKDLEIPNIPFANESQTEERQVTKIVVKPLEDLINSAKAEEIILLGNSAYRSYDLQKSIYKDSVKAYGKKYTEDYVAKAGFSEHQTGLAIDITNEHRYFVKGTNEADWLEKNCYKFGFIIRYPEGKNDITGIAYEPWHIRYVGEQVATYIHNKGITLEEYLEEQ